MKRYLYLALPLLAAMATPALAANANPQGPAAPDVTPAAAQRATDREAMTEQVRQKLARLREALEGRKEDTKSGSAAAQHDVQGLCSDCPEKDTEAHHHSVSDERKADCPECVERAIYA
jgi:Skp family chaperone for outer membrane proteins